MGSNGMITQIKSINDLLSIIKEHQEEFNSSSNSQSKGPSWYKYNANLWFRGQADSSFNLEPQVERKAFIETARLAGDSPLAYEKTIYKKLLAQGAHLIPENLNQIEVYFLSQHYGLPTRLLDWSRNPLAAFFFSVISHKEKDGSIYMYFSRADIPGHEENDIVSQNDDKVTSLLGFLTEDNIIFDVPECTCYPLKIEPNAQAGRIVNQVSCFTLHHPNSTVNLDNLVGSQIRKYTIPAQDKPQIINDLQMLGVSWGNLFPDLENMVKDIKRQAYIE
ncbi:MAG: FRG domain-containing protein [Candidatus Electrothrix sp. Rat3]|nr:FRG domain-containing protein [Candidatus Electrothrix rattekaaiensis]